MRDRERNDRESWSERKKRQRGRELIEFVDVSGKWKGVSKSERDRGMMDDSRGKREYIFLAWCLLRLSRISVWI